MRQLFLALALLGWPALVVAQSPATPAAPAAEPVALPLPHIGLPLAPIGLPLPPLGLQPLPPDAPRRATGNREPGPHRNRVKGNHDRRLVPGPIVVFYGFPPVDISERSATPGAIAQTVTPAVEASTTGRLRLEVEPAALLQLFVDNEYVGTPDDIGSELDLEAGTRRIEIRAPGYETTTFDVRIIARQAITYRGALTPAAAQPLTVTEPDPATEPAIPARRQTFYFIPGCYLGNIPPEDVKLPPGCDLSRLITRTP